MICINPFNDLSNRYVEAVEEVRRSGRKVRKKEDGGAQTGQSRIVGLGAKVCRRGAASGSECGRRCASSGRLVRGNADKGAQTRGGRGECLGAKVGLGARGMVIGIHRSLSEPIGIYRRGSALFGFVLIDSDKF